jgi:hypothetical protein
MTENSNSNEDNGAGQIAMTDDLFGWPCARSGSVPVDRNQLRRTLIWSRFQQPWTPRAVCAGSAWSSTPARPGRTQAGCSSERFCRPTHRQVSRPQPNALGSRQTSLRPMSRSRFRLRRVTKQREGAIGEFPDRGTPRTPLEHRSAFTAEAQACSPSEVSAAILDRRSPPQRRAAFRWAFCPGRPGSAGASQSSGPLLAEKTLSSLEFDHQGPC